MYITNKPEIAKIAENAGVDRIFIDMEYIGKAKRQGGMDTVKNRHTVEDVRKVRKVISKSKLLVRINPIHEATNEYYSSKEEIDSVIDAGANILMLPFFKTVAEVERFIKCVNGRAKTILLLETPEAVEIIDDIIKINGIDEIHIGINDLSLGYRKKFMFELLTDGTVERICLKLKQSNIPYGFGGVSAVGTGQLPAEVILKEHYRLGSSMVILSRSFCNTSKETDINIVKEKFDTGIKVIRSFEAEIQMHSSYFVSNTSVLRKYVRKIAEDIK